MDTNINYDDFNSSKYRMFVPKASLGKYKNKEPWSKAQSIYPLYPATAIAVPYIIVSAKDESGVSVKCLITVTAATGIGTISLGSVKITISNRRLRVEGLADNDAIHMANAKGFTVYKSTEHEVNIYAAGIYIIKVKGKTLKLTVE